MFFYEMNLTQKRKLIDIVESHPDLWKLSRKAPNLKQQLWIKVGTQLNTSGFDARRQWEILRDQFRREYKRIQQDRNYESKWALYKRMLFARNALRGIHGSAVPFSDIEEHSPNEQLQQHQSPNADSSQKRLGDNWTLKPEILNTPPKIKVRQDLQGGNESSSSQGNFIPIAADGEPSTSAGVSSSSQPNPRFNEIDIPKVRRKRWRGNTTSTAVGHEDEDYHFVMSILPSLRCIRHNNKLRVRSKIMELIAAELDDEDYEAKNHQQRSVKDEIATDSEVDEKPAQLIPEGMLQCSLNANMF